MSGKTIEDVRSEFASRLTKDTINDTLDVAIGVLDYQLEVVESFKNADEEAYCRGQIFVLIQTKRKLERLKS